MDDRFLNADFLLSNGVAQTLFHNTATHAPIVDVHNHLPPLDIEGDRTWTTLTELWLDDDHYKWRAMRHAGVDESLITGSADPWDKFQAWAMTLQRSFRNPLYVWSHLELRRVFGIDIALTPSSAQEIWDEANRQLPNWSAQTLLRHFNVSAVATTDDPADTLDVHARHARVRETGPSQPTVAMLPTFRPDAAHRLLEDPTAWSEWAERLTASTGVAITDLDSLLAALSMSYARFASLGGRASDHGLASIPDRPRDPARANNVVRSALAGRAATREERDVVLLEVVGLAARLAHGDDSVLQVHLGPVRNVSPRLLAVVGRDAGADAMGDEPQIAGLARFLGDLEADGVLPRTVLYNLNPADNVAFSTLAGSLSRPGVSSLVQWGPPWWFNDQESGMRRQLDDLAQIGQLAGFIGMLTDSRSILSMTRHELFRRVLCDEIGRDVEAGRYPHEIAYLSAMVHDICVGNAVQYFGFPPQWAL
jgi:glucuronate isomerase